MLESGIKKGLACCEAKCARFLRATVTVRGNSVQLGANALARFARGSQRSMKQRPASCEAGAAAQIAGAAA